MKFYTILLPMMFGRIIDLMICTSLQVINKFLNSKKE